MPITTVHAIHVGPQIQPTVRIINKTGQKIVIQFKTRNEDKPRIITLNNEELIDIGPSEPVELFSVMPEGQYKEWLSAHKISGGYWGLKNYSRDIRVAQNKDPNKVLIAEIEPSIVFPYTLKFSYLDISPKTEKKTLSVLSFFDQVRDAIKEGKKIEPRYFLSTRLNADKNQIQQRYTELRQEWEPKAIAGSKFAQHVLKFIDAAYKALLGAPSDKPQFELLVATERQDPKFFTVEA